jgi:ATP-dependent Clp protease ATP-binding subunit ClpA
MVKRPNVDALKTVLISAAEEVRCRGDRRLGTDHILLGLLHDADSSTAQALGVSLAAARSAWDALDRAALAAVGVDSGQFSGPPRPVPSRRLPPLTSGARAVVKCAIEEARPAKIGRVEARHFLLALLLRERPDPAAELLGALEVDPAQVRSRLGGPVA